MGAPPSAKPEPANAKAKTLATQMAQIQQLHETLSASHISNSVTWAVNARDEVFFQSTGDWQRTDGALKENVKENLTPGRTPVLGFS